MGAILDYAVTEMALPDGTIVTRSDICDDGHVDENGNGCIHFNNDDHTASFYMSYSSEDSGTRCSEILQKQLHYLHNFFFRLTGDLHLPNGNVFALETDSGIEVQYQLIRKMNK